ncbi:hypothetical protein LJC04_06745, partial [Ruminococcaceae bacterium OttesenSCG-928-O06]|nr:hypothetical protein [Ruminococcaceae bacterium OttesenSCG-928-O06]
MVKTKHRVTSVLLTLCLTVVMLAGILIAAPVQVKAAGGNATWNSATPPDISAWDVASNTITVSSGAKGTLTIPAAVTEITIIGDGNAVTGANIVLASRTAGLTINFDNLNMTAPAGESALSSTSTGVNTTLNVTGTVRLTGGAGANGTSGTHGSQGMNLAGTVTVAGTGTLHATGGNGGDGTTGNGGWGGDGILTSSALTVSGALVATGGNGGASQSGNGGPGG